jgi:hypothetical protein
VRPSEDGELLSEREDLQDQVGPATEDREESPGDGKSAVEHPRTITAVRTESKRARPRAIRESCIGTQLVEAQAGWGYGEA